ncbi:PP2C family protein-serine/threonine phosphatase [Stackebrandtia endophytica]|uniref:PP2C family protein-serine/threonine phosphatase n=1 Tax=Stackebrandtia endophytica TaxID=1496996 RepID=UPI001150B951|nr:PP2C family protein-serine/threonine phosphatase [Stackebrandtia endophytica]
MVLQLTTRKALPGERAPGWARWLPLLVLVALVPAHLLTPADVQFTFAVVAMPPLAALMNGPLFTSLVSAASIGLFSWLYLYAGHDSSVYDTDTDGLSMLVGICLMSVLMAWVRERYSARLVRVNTVAEAAQLAVLPNIPDEIGSLRCAAWYRPAEQDTMVGGDLFDVQNTSYGVRVIVGDVKGHGLDAVSTVSALLGSFREGVLDDPDLDRLGVRLERRMTWDNSGRSEWATSFATALMMEFPPGNREVRIITYGHPTPLLLREGEVRELHAPPGPPLGLAGQLTSEVATITVSLTDDDLLLAYTDGVIEARDRKGRFYPLIDRLGRRLSEVGRMETVELAEFIDSDLDAFGARIRDDVAVLAIRVDD